MRYAATSVYGWLCGGGVKVNIVNFSSELCEPASANMSV